MSSILRAAKYNFKGYSSIQAKACDATSNDPQPPTGGQMNELAQLSYNPDHFAEIAAVLDKRLDAKGRNWRHVYKSLIVLDYLLHSGSEIAVLYFQKNAYVVKTLKEFQFVDEDGKDQGANVRIKAKDIAALLADDSRLQEIRRTRAEMRDRMLGRTMTSSSNSSELDEDLENENVQRRSVLTDSSSSDDDSLRLQSARAQIRQARAAEERGLLNAMRMSQAFPADTKAPSPEPKVEADSPPAPTPSPPTQEPDFSLLGANQSTQQPQTQPQPTSNDPNLLVTFDGMDHLTPHPAPQFATFNPFQVQAQQNLFQQQQDWMQMQAAQQLQQQQELWLQQQYLQQQQEIQQHMQQQAYQFAQFERVPPIQTQPTTVFKSNNPFAPTVSPSPSLFSISSSPSIPSPRTPSSPSPQFGSFTSEPTSTLMSSPLTRKSTNPFPAIDTQHLDNLFANRDDNGLDTFGNFGQLRYGQTLGQIQSA